LVWQVWKVRVRLARPMIISFQRRLLNTREFFPESFARLLHKMITYSILSWEIHWGHLIGGAKCPRGKLSSLASIKQHHVFFVTEYIWSIAISGSRYIINVDNWPHRRTTQSHSEQLFYTWISLACLLRHLRSPAGNTRQSIPQTSCHLWHNHSRLSDSQQNHILSMVNIRSITDNIVRYNSQPAHFNGTSTQLRYTVTLVHAWKYRTEDKLRQTIQKLNTTQKANNANTAKHNYPGLVAFYDTRPGKNMCLFYNAPKSALSWIKCKYLKA